MLARQRGCRWPSTSGIYGYRFNQVPSGYRMRKDGFHLQRSHFFASSSRGRALKNNNNEEETEEFLTLIDHTDVHPLPPPIIPTPVTLRPYQHDCIEWCLDDLSKGRRRQLVSLPVGSGKTVIFANLIPRIPPPTPHATKTLVLCHRAELLHQAKKSTFYVKI